MQPTAWLCSSRPAGSAWPEHRGGFSRCALAPALFSSTLRLGRPGDAWLQGGHHPAPLPSRAVEGVGTGVAWPPKGLEKRPCQQFLAPQPLPSFPER